MRCVWWYYQQLNSVWVLTSIKTADIYCRYTSREMSETGLLCTLFTLTFLNIALKMIKHLFDEVEKKGTETGHWVFFTPKGFVQSSIKGNSLHPRTPFSFSFISCSPSYGTHHWLQLKALSHLFSFPFHIPSEGSSCQSRIRSLTLMTKKLTVQSQRSFPENIFFKNTHSSAYYQFQNKAQTQLFQFQLMM